MAIIHPMDAGSLAHTGRTLNDSGLVVREARRLAGLERRYGCSCGATHTSWSRMSECTDCGRSLRTVVAVVTRAALTV